ncbi:hypothetical protein BDR07DRAFT_1608072 [Suillus spraguei]|nr:hypothetical protein BDR07DRAFT_1608072 [Suillus spraguei]
MHAALGNLEVIYTIFSYTQLGTLPALASTCGAFEHPALNILWRDLPSPEPLIQCLPSHLFSTDQGRIILQKPPDSMIWDTLFKYTSRIHSITATESFRLTAIIEPLGSIMLSCPSAPASLFPNLRKLIWSADGTHGAAEFLRMTLVPSLSVLDIRCRFASSAFLSVLSSAGVLCPHLQDMALRIQHITDEPFRKISPFVTQFISQFHYLHSLLVCDLGHQGIEHVMQSRALRSLHLDLRRFWAPCERQSCAELPGFHDLTSLGLSTDTLKSASNFLSSLRVVESKEIKVEFNRVPSKSEYTMLSQFFTILKERCDTDRLEGFTLIGIYGKVRTELSVFKPLQACRNLARLSVERGCNISISDEELCQLVRDWPKLEVLKISCYDPVYSTTMPTLHGLIELLRLCPILTSLALVIDATKLNGIDIKSPDGGRRNKYLKHLDLGNSLVGTPLKVALIISGLFPNLEQVNFDCLDTMQIKKSTRERRASINSLLSSFRIVKERFTEA